MAYVWKKNAIGLSRLPYLKTYSSPYQSWGAVIIVTFLPTTYKVQTVCFTYLSTVAFT